MSKDREKVGNALATLGANFKTRNDIICRHGQCPHCGVYHHSFEEIKAAAIEQGIEVYEDGTFKILDYKEWMNKRQLSDSADLDGC